MGLMGRAGKITPAVNSAATTSPSIKLPADSCKDLGIQQGIWEDKSWVCLGSVGKKGENSAPAGSVCSLE